jgi:7,8-dihydropterin-6-yl-methyl-4-(beta-D-ribofuranosyl)aminobenzene 5'-phosphate synthase
MFKVRVSGFIFLLNFMAFSNSFAEDISMRIVYNNISYDKELICGWGMGCVIEGLEKTILFDTGGDGTILLSNMERMGIDPEEIDIVVLSHIHGDHTGGLRSFMDSNPDVTVYLPSSFPSNFKREVSRRGARIVEISEPVEIMTDVYSTGELGTLIREQALIIRSVEGLVIVTGCAHPGVVTISKEAMQFLDDEIYLITGGFHLGGATEKKIESIIAELKALGVKMIAPSHCTGDTAMKMFRNAWNQNFIQGGCGATINIPPAQ